MTHASRLFIVEHSFAPDHHFLILLSACSGGTLPAAVVMEGFHHLGLSESVSECAVDALRRYIESCGVGSGNVVLSYTQLLLDVVGAAALPALSPTDFADQM
jgi:hypothetical protein